MKTNCFIISGPQRSGKTYYAKELAAKYNLYYPEFNKVYFNVNSLFLPNNEIGTFAFNNCNEKTGIIIIDEIVKKEHLLKLIEISKYESIKVDQRGKNPIYIKPLFIFIVQCDQQTMINNKAIDNVLTVMEL
jgi:hypothetical protein